MVLWQFSFTPPPLPGPRPLEGWGAELANVPAVWGGEPNELTDMKVWWGTEQANVPAA